MRQFPEATYAAIKAASRDLVTAAGGQSRVERITRTCQSSLSKALSANDGNCFLPIDVIADIEAETNTLTITKMLAGLAGYDLVPRVAKAETETLMSHVARMSIEAGTLQSDLITALADGVINPVERISILSGLDSVSERINTIRNQVSAAPTAKAVRA